MKHSSEGPDASTLLTEHALRSPKEIWASVDAAGSLANAGLCHDWAGPASLPIDWLALSVSWTDFCFAHRRDWAKKASCARLASPEYGSTSGILEWLGLRLTGKRGGMAAINRA